MSKIKFAAAKNPKRPRKRRTVKRKLRKSRANLSTRAKNPAKLRGPRKVSDVHVIVGRLSSGHKLYFTGGSFSSIKSKAEPYPTEKAAQVIARGLIDAGRVPQEITSLQAVRKSDA